MGENVNVQVAVRCRPINDGEKSKGATRVVKISGERVFLHNPFPSSGNKEHNFTFDNCYYGDIKTEQLYKDVAEPLVRKTLDGYNVAHIAYGQTGSGKTYTICGSIEEQGLVNLVTAGLFAALSESLKPGQFFLTASYVLISDAAVHDLLNPSGRDLKIRQHPQLGMYVDDLAELIVGTPEDALRLHEQGNRVRKLMLSDFNTSMASGSTVFTITVDQKPKTGQGKGFISKISFVDLAGSEHKSTSEDGRPVNSSIATLQTVIAALENKQNVGFRNSKLTRLLQNCLGGNAYTTFLTTISPTDSDFYETLSALQVANKAKNVQNTPKKNENDTSTIVKEIRDEIERVRDKLVTHLSSPTNAPNPAEVETMEALVKDLQRAKLQTWDEKERLSQMFEEERRHHLANRGILDWVLDTSKRESKEVQERLATLQKEKDKLLLDYKERRKGLDELKDKLQMLIADYSKLTETGKSGDEESKQKVSEIHQLKEKLKEENDTLKKIKQEMKDVQEKLKAEKEEAKSQTSSLVGNPEVRQRMENEQREKVEKENLANLAEEMDRIKVETEQEKAEIKLKRAEGVQYSGDEALQLEMEVLDLKSEKAVMAFKIKSLEGEKKQLKKDIEEAYRRHKDETELQQLQYFQTFRNYREVFEEQKAALEQRYRGLLEDAIQDAIFLSARNQELMEENGILKQENAELRDKVTIISGRPTSPLTE